MKIDRLLIYSLGVDHPTEVVLDGSDVHIVTRGENLYDVSVGKDRTLVLTQAAPVVWLDDRVLSAYAKKRGVA